MGQYTFRGVFNLNSANPVTFVVKVGPSCQANVTSWKQYTPWSAKDYDNSYITTTLYATKNSPRVSNTGQMELLNGLGTFTLSLTPATNNLIGLAALLSSQPGTNAVVGGSAGNYNLSVYNTRYRTGSGFPRPTNALHLCDGTCSSSAAKDILLPKKMSAEGCAVTALAMALIFVGVKNVQESSGPADFNPLELNDFMSNALALPALGGTFSTTGDVDFRNTPRYVAANTGRRSLRLETYGPSINSDFDLPGAEAALDKALCTDQVPFIVGVQSPITGVFPQHYVLVTGKDTHPDGTPKYLIQDPAGFGTDFDTAYTNAQGKPELVTRGAVKDPSDLSEFNVSTDNNADLMVKDVNGRETGFDNSSGAVLQQMPGSAYFADQIGDDVDGSSATGLNHSVGVLSPAQGTYRMFPFVFH